MGIPRKNKELDRLKAKSLSRLSAIASKFPERLDFIIDRSAPSAVRARWVYDSSLDWRSHPLKAQWLEVSRDDNAGRFPKNYPCSVILQIDREIMDRQLSIHARLPVTPAVAYKLGEATMVGYSTEHQILGLEREDDPDYKVAMGIGRGLLVAGAGVVVNPIPNLHIYTPLSEGLSLGPVVPKPEIPISIPSV